MIKTDKQVQDDVEAELRWDPRLDADRIVVAARSGVLSLHGVVHSLAEKHAAEAAAKRVIGVHAIADALTISLRVHHAHPDEDIAAAARYVIDWNSWIPKTVKATVHEGEISLKGEVEFKFQRDAATSAVKHLAGVVGVRDELSIVPRASATEVQDLLEAALERQAGSDAESIVVSTAGGVVTLSGQVSSWACLEDAAEAAWSAPGVTMVNNHLTLKRLESARA